MAEKTMAEDDLTREREETFHVVVRAAAVAVAAVVVVLALMALFLV